MQSYNIAFLNSALREVLLWMGSLLSGEGSFLCFLFLFSFGFAGLLCLLCWGFFFFALLMFVTLYMVVFVFLWLASFVTAVLLFFLLVFKFLRSRVFIFCHFDIMLWCLRPYTLYICFFFCQLSYWFENVALNKQQGDLKRLQQETLFLGVGLLYRFLSKGFFKTERNLQIVGIACLVLATRLEENQPYNR